ncbi:MAG TPA: RNA polymerase subunit sigma [Planctomycetaceae bacterium]|nr:RNA polymerase subunit sigma [Planctomycetaceae bacterium]
MVTDLNETQTCTITDLVIRAQEGDREAQCQLYQRYQQTVLNLAYRLLGNWDEAEELSQDVFIHAFERIGQLRVAAAFGGWLRQIVRRMAVNRLTRRRPVFAVESEVLDAAQDLGATPLDDLLKSERHQQVRQGLKRLGDTDRRTLEAFYMGGQSLIQMAEYFEAPIGTIKRRLHVARLRLAAEIGDSTAI